MNHTNTLRAAMIGLFGALAMGAVAAEEAKPGSAAAAAVVIPQATIGMGVTSSDGAVLGKVTSLKAAGDGKPTILYVTSPTDGKIFAVPSELATTTPGGIQVKATAAELGKMVK
jgi:hypothetical protein